MKKSHITNFGDLFRPPNIECLEPSYSVLLCFKTACPCYGYTSHFILPDNRAEGEIALVFSCVYSGTVANYGGFGSLRLTSNTPDVLSSRFIGDAADVHVLMHARASLRNTSNCGRFHTSLPLTAFLSYDSLLAFRTWV